MLGSQAEVLLEFPGQGGLGHMELARQTIAVGSLLYVGEGRGWNIRPFLQLPGVAASTFRQPSCGTPRQSCTELVSLVP